MYLFTDITIDSYEETLKKLIFASGFDPGDISSRLMDGVCIHVRIRYLECCSSSDSNIYEPIVYFPGNTKTFPAKDVFPGFNLIQLIMTG